MTTRDELVANIRYQERCADNYRQEMNQLRQQSEELERLRDKLEQLKGRFGDRQAQRKNGLARMQSRTLSNSIFNKYCEGMSQLLNGMEFTQAYGGLDEAKNRVVQKLRDIAEAINDLNNDYHRCLKNADYWQNELNHFQEEEEL